jgi:hypothetical protein
MFRCEGCGGKGTRLAIDAEESGGCRKEEGEASEGTKTRHFAALAEGGGRRRSENKLDGLLHMCGPIEFDV